METRIPRLAIMLLVAALLLPACQPEEEEPGLAPPDEPGIPDTGELAMEGEFVYADQCATCHMEDGSGVEGTYPELDGTPFVLSPDATPVIEVVLHGREAMPAFSDILDDREIAAVVSYIRTAWTNDAGPVSPEEVQALR